MPGANHTNLPYYMRTLKTVLRVNDKKKLIIASLFNTAI